MSKLKEMDKKRLEKTGFRFVGDHSAVKTCEWTRKAVAEKGYCYKQKFYGIQTHQCLQMTPAFQFCTHRCLFCWRDISITHHKWSGKADEPKFILDNAIAERKELLQGFKGNPSVNSKKFEEAVSVKQVAISLAGEPTLYPKLPELVDEINSRGMTSFLVSNGTQPQMIKKLLKHQPTQLYITLPAPDEKTYLKTCQPLIKDGWKKLMKSLALLKKFRCNTVVRLTLVKKLNFIKPEGYARIIRKSKPKFVEVKSFMAVGYSRQRLPYSAMPMHQEIRKFSKTIAKKSGYCITDEKSDSRVVLLKKIDEKA